VLLQRWGFSEGSKLSLSGQVPAADTQQLLDFYDTLRKAKKNGVPFFTSESEPPAFHQLGNTVGWNFSLVLAHVEDVNQ
jgi:hypothetical protein